MMRKKLLLLFAAILLSLSAAENVDAQSSRQRKSFVTISMARKITYYYYCHHSSFAMAVFADANGINSSMELDITISTLDKHLDCAEKFLLDIPYRYGGVEMGYLALKDMRFTMQEIDAVLAEWRKDDERRAALAKQRRKEKEQRYLKLIEENGVFTSKQLSIQPKINIDLTSISRLLPYNPKGEPLNYRFHCIVSKDGYVSLQDESDTLSYTDTEKAIYNNYIKGYNAFEVGKVEIESKQMPVNSKVRIDIEEVRRIGAINSELTFEIRKDKRLNSWFVVWGKDFRNQELRCKDLQGFKSQLTGALYNCHGLEKLKDGYVYYIEVKPYHRKLECNLSDDNVEDVYLPHIFEITLLNIGTKLDYETCCIPENAFEKEDEAYILRCNKMEKKYQKHPNRFVDVSMKDGDSAYYISNDGFDYNFASEACNICLLEKEGVYMLFHEQKFVKRK